MNAPRLLVVDDSPTVRKVVELSLRSTEWEVEFAATGTEGAALAAGHRPDLILVDYVLPDMKATEMCQMLAGDDRTCNLPVILMSGSIHKIRHLFKNTTNVVDFVAKPFTPQDLVSRILSARQRRPPSSVRSYSQSQSDGPRDPRSVRSDVVPPDETSVVVRKIVERWLRTSQIPAPNGRLQSNVGGSLPPNATEELLAALLPVLKSSSSSSSPEPSSDDQSAAFLGTLEQWSVLEILRIFGASERTGELRVISAEETAVLYIRRGEILFATSTNATSYTQGVREALAQVDRDARAAAEVDQAATGKPVFVSLAEQGLFPQADLAQTLDAQGRRVLLRATETNHAKFSWRDTSSFPLYVEAYGRAIFPEQLPLERHRRDRPVARAENELHGTAVLDRGPGFSKKLRRLDLTSEERLVLALIEGNRSVDDVIRRSGLMRQEAMLILHRLIEIQLVRFREAVSRVSCTESRVVMIFEPDAEGFQRPLAEMLRARAEPFSLVAFKQPDEIWSAVEQSHPRLLIVNVSAVKAEWSHLATAIRMNPSLAGLGIIAILDRGDEHRVDEFAHAGFDAVLRKPVLYHDIELWLDN